MIYLPISMGYRMCYKRYMFALGYDVWSKPNGAMMVEGIEGRPVNPGEFISFKMYYLFNVEVQISQRGRIPLLSIMGKIWNCQFTIRSNQGVLIILAI